MWPENGIHISRTLSNPLNSDISTHQTVELMSRLAKASSTSAIVHAALLSATDTLSIPATSRALARAIFCWIKGHVVFQEDEALIWQGLGIADVDKELLIPPDVLLRMPTPMGDCDDFSLLGASMLLAAGLPCSFITVAADPEEPDKFSHIYLKVYLLDENMQGLMFDSSHGSYLGWEFQGWFRKEEWRVS